MISLDEALNLCRPDEWYREDYLVCLYHYAAMLRENSTIVELGCYRGLSTLMLACGMPKGSHIYTIDPIFQTGTITFPNVNNTTLTMSSNLGDVRAFWAKAGVNNLITVIPEYSWDVVDRWLYELPSLVFFDAEHTTEAIVRDARWLDLVKPLGYCVADDWIDVVEAGFKIILKTRPEWSFLPSGHTRPIFLNDPRGPNMALTILQKGKY